MKKTLYVFVWACCALLALPADAQVPGYVPTDGLVGWWPFNGNANDESGNGNDGVVNGATLTEDRNGIANKAYSFNGIDNYINVPFSPAFNSIQDGLTMSAWVLMSGGTGPSTPPRVMELRGAYGNGGDAGFVMLAQDNSNVSRTFEVRWYNDYGNTNVSISPTNSVSSTVWHYLVYTADGNTGVGKFYVDGQFINDNSAMQLQGFIDSCNYNNNPLIIGAETNLLGLWGGKLDDIAIYNRALTEQEIQNLYTGTAPAPCAALPSNLQQGLVGYWPFCGNANDESGNGNDGTVNGATLTEDRFGNAESAYTFDGNSSSIGIAEGENFASDTFSISFWTKYNSIPQNDASITLGASESAKWAVYYDGGFSLATGLVCNGNYSPSESYPISTNDWYHVLITNTTNQQNIYTNGILTGQTSNVFGVNCSIDSLNFGLDIAGIAEYFHGSLDDIGIWNRALTPEEVQELYTLDACTFTIYDTVYTYETIYDTVTTYITVTDTLLIDITLTSVEGQPGSLNTVTVFPNPASDHITIDYGNFALMNGYNTIITDAAGATVYSSAVNTQQVEVDINAWGAMGVYYMSIYDVNGALVAVRHIVLQ